MGTTWGAEGESYRVVLLGVGKDTPEEKSAFCRRISSRYGISLPLVEKIVGHLPVVLKKNLSRGRSEALARLISSSGGRVSIEKRADAYPVGLEFQPQGPAPMALESCTVQRTTWGSWSVLGRARNVSPEALEDIWVLVQLFGEGEELLIFEEVPLSLNPVLPGVSAPFRAIFDGHLPLKRVTIAFKQSSGRPVAAENRLRRKEWIPWKTVPPQGEGELGDSDLDAPVLELYGKFDDEPEGKKEERGVLEREEILERDEGKEAEEASSFELGHLPSEGPGQGSAAVGRTLSEEGRDAETEGMCPTPEEGFTEDKEATVERAMRFPQDEGALPSAREEGDPSLGFEGSLDPFQEVPKEGRRRGIRPEEVLPFPWLDAFREAVHAFDQKDPHGFSVWLNNPEMADRFQGPFHRAMTILAHARFSQMCSSDKALENTKRVFEAMLKEGLEMEEIPPLEGTRFASGEVWRNLFFKAVPKLKEIAEEVVSKKEWEALELEKLIQVIPQMSLEASRLATRLLSSLMKDGIRVDFRKTSPKVGGALYRVASRLGIVDPLFDHYRGPHSIGDTKLQAFARTAFPDNPRKIEEPMNWVGREEEGGHCLPIHPACGGCLFEPFCPKLRLDLDPSLKGVFSQD